MASLTMSIAARATPTVHVRSNRTPAFRSGELLQCNRGVVGILFRHVTRAAALEHCARFCSLIRVLHYRPCDKARKLCYRSQGYR